MLVKTTPSLFLPQGRCSVILGSPKGKIVPSSSSSPVRVRSVPVHAGVHLCSALRREAEVACCSSQRTISEGQSGASQAVHKVHHAPAARLVSMQKIQQF